MFTTVKRPERPIDWGEETEFPDADTLDFLEQDLYRRLKECGYLNFVTQLPKLWYMTSLKQMEMLITSVLFNFVIFHHEQKALKPVVNSVLEHGVPVREIKDCLNCTMAEEHLHEAFHNLEDLCILSNNAQGQERV